MMVDFTHEFYKKPSPACGAHHGILLYGVFVKRCSKCKRELPERMFYWKIKSRRLRMEICKPCKAAKQRRYRSTDRGRALRAVYNSDYFARHPEYQRNYKKTLRGGPLSWRQTPLGQLASETSRETSRKAANKRKELRRRGAKGGFSDTDWDLKKQMHPYCWICGLPEGPSAKFELTQDHLVPLSRGGTHTWDNIMPAHRSCNSSKGAKMMFADRQALLVL